MTHHPSLIRGLCSSFAVVMGVYTRDLFGDSRQTHVLQCRSVLAYTLNRRMQLSAGETAGALGVTTSSVENIVRRMEQRGIDRPYRNLVAPAYWILLAEAFFRRELNTP